MLVIDFSIMDLGSTEKGLVYPSGQRKGAKSLRHSLQNCKASLVRTRLLILGEHGKHFRSSYSEMVITPVFETGIQGSTPCKNI